MKFVAIIAGIALATLAACNSGSDDPTQTPTAAPDATTAPTTAGPVETQSSFVALVDLATGQQVTVHDGLGTWNSWFEPDGQAVNALATAAGTRPRSVRVALDGSVLADSATELQQRVNAEGTARAYAGINDDGGTFKTRLESGGNVIDLEGDLSALPLSFSPQGDRLLSYIGVPAPEGEAALSYTVHNLDGTLQTSFVNRLSATNPGSSPATWSPSGKYVATIGLDGLTVNDIRGGGAFLVPVNGSTEWSPTEDALIVVAGATELQILRLPNMAATSLAVSVEGVAASFDPSGRVVTVSDPIKGITTVFDAATGERLVEWGGVAEPFNIMGFEPVQMTDAGLAAILQGALDCDGFLVIHPAGAPRGQCVDGANPRWSPDVSSVAFTRGDEIVLLEIEPLTERVVATGLPTTDGGTLARWNAGGTHLLLEWPWGGGGWSDRLP